MDDDDNVQDEAVNAQAAEHDAGVALNLIDNDLGLQLDEDNLDAGLQGAPFEAALDQLAILPEHDDPIVGGVNNVQGLGEQGQSSEEEGELSDDDANDPDYLPSDDDADDDEQDVPLRRSSRIPVPSRKLLESFETM